MEIKTTCLHDRHVALGAKMEPFAGFDMPIQYSSIIEEHEAVRKHCGVFDVSHMGEVWITGPDAERYVNHIFTNDISHAPAGKVFYGMMCYPHGGTVDDLLVYCMGEGTFLLVVNAANIDKDYQWMLDQQAGFDVVIDNQSDRYGQLAIQGPEAEKVTLDVLGIDGSDLAFYEVKRLDGVELGIISRTGYTGEDGFEIYAAPAVICEMWDKLMLSGQCKPCGLGCRDTLRFEVGLPLYGDELSEDISPVMAGLSMFCKFDKEEFIGKEALQKQKTEGVQKKLVGIELAGRAIPRHGYDVLKNGVVIGQVTTGYHCLSVDKSTCVALIDSQEGKLGNEVEVQIRKKTFPGTIVKKRFYEKHYKK